MQEPALPSVTYADYKRAIRGSKIKSNTKKRDSINEEVYTLANLPSQNNKKKNKKGKSNNPVSNCEDVKTSERSSSSLLQSHIATSPAGTRIQSSADRIEQDSIPQNLLRTDETTTTQCAAAEDEGFEVFEDDAMAAAGEMIETSLTIQYTISGENESLCSTSGESGSPFVMESQESPQPWESTAGPNDITNTTEPIQITKSVSCKSNDDSIFSKEGPKKESPHRVIVPAASLSDATKWSKAIDMTGCIRTSFSPSVSSSMVSSSNNNNGAGSNIRKLDFTPSPKNRSNSQPQKEEVSSEPSNSGDNQRWQDFTSSLSLLGAPVLSWFSATPSDGVVASDELATPCIQNNGIHQKAIEEEGIISDTAPVVVNDENTSTSATSEAYKKRHTTPSLSSTDAGSLSSHDVVGEVAATPRVEIALARQLSRFFSNKDSEDDSRDDISIYDWSQRTWNKFMTCIPSKEENPKGWYIFAFGVYLISASIFTMLLLLAGLSLSKDESAFMFANETLAPSSVPTVTTSTTPSDSPSLVPSMVPTNSPTITARPTESQVPSTVPSEAPSHKPSIELSFNPTMTAVPTSEPITYVPGKLTVKSNGLILSEGLASRIVARSGQKVLLNGRRLPSNQNDWNASSATPTSAPTAWSLESHEVFHFKPDGAAAYLWAENEDYDGEGWVYVSNSEVWEQGGGGVGAIYFDDKGRVVDYKMLLKETTANCAGGKTPWHTWVTCEESDDGRIFQVDPLGIRPPEEMTIGMGRGKWESFAYDIRDQSKPRFFATEDHQQGTLRRFTPDEPAWDDPWTMLQGNGTVDYLVLEPFDWDGRRSGTFFWTDDLQLGKDNAKRYYQHSEGIDVRDKQLFVVSKTQKELFILNLDATTYEVHSTVFGMFDGQPDQMKRLISDDDKVGTKHDKSLLYFCEEGGRNNGIHARDSNGWYFTILESDDLDGETSGLAFSPDGKHMYFSYQHRGIIFDVWREDGRPFHGKTLSVKYHGTGDATSR